jgi:hypothetical protein
MLVRQNEPQRRRGTETDPQPNLPESLLCVSVPLWFNLRKRTRSGPATRLKHHVALGEICDLFRTELGALRLRYGLIQPYPTG